MRQQRDRVSWPPPGRCLCGTVLSGQNPGRECASCERVRRAFETLGERTAWIAARARQTSYCYRSGALFEDPEAWLAELTACLDRESEACGQAPPGDLVEPWEKILAGGLAGGGGVE